MANQLFTLLKQDHQEAKQLMEQIAGASQEKREQLFIDLSDALTLHMQIEEKNFYPRIQNQQGMKQMVADALEEHQETRDQLQKLETLDAADSQWLQTFKQMQKGVLHHVQEEEKEIFPKCTQVLSDTQLNEIAQKCREQKQAAQPTKTQKQPEKRV